MRKTGIAELPLHEGKAPKWLIIRMKSLGEQICQIIIRDFGYKELLSRLSNPFWFQSFGCVLGYDWHSSGVTTVVTGVLKSVLNIEKFGVAIAGGKGKISRKTPEEISLIASKINISNSKINELIRASRLSAKVDNSVLQDGHQLYHHVFILTEKGEWAVIQQGMNIFEKTARRYHWLGEKVKSFVVEPHSGIISDKKLPYVLNMTSKESEEARKCSVDIACEKPSRVIRLFNEALKNQKSLDEWIESTKEENLKFKLKGIPEYLKMPRKINWAILKKVYEFQPKNYEQLIEIRGLGQATIRGLALISALIYGYTPNLKDPVRFSFAYGGKDGVPFPVDIKAMDESISFLKQVLEASEINKEEKIEAFRRLKNLINY
ncbi:MAG: DUF763 domain-containing protein [Nitrososphaerota archaeon]